MEWIIIRHPVLLILKLGKNSRRRPKGETTTASRRQKSRRGPSGAARGGAIRAAGGISDEDNSSTRMDMMMWGIYELAVCLLDLTAAGIIASYAAYLLNVLNRRT